MKTLIAFKSYLLFITLLITIHVIAQQEDINSGMLQTTHLVAPVKLDGNVLFSIRGVSALPAEERANIISQRIKSVAANYNISVESIKTIEEKRNLFLQKQALEIEKKNMPRH